MLLAVSKRIWAEFGITIGVQKNCTSRDSSLQAELRSQARFEEVVILGIHVQINAGSARFGVPIQVQMRVLERSKWRHCEPIRKKVIASRNKASIALPAIIRICCSAKTRK